MNIKLGVRHLHDVLSEFDTEFVGHTVHCLLLFTLRCPQFGLHIHLWPLYYSLSNVHLKTHLDYAVGL